MITEPTQNSVNGCPTNILEICKKVDHIMGDIETALWDRGDIQRFLPINSIEIRQNTNRLKILSDALGEMYNAIPDNSDIISNKLGKISLASIIHYKQTICQMQEYLAKIINS